MSIEDALGKTDLFAGLPESTLKAIAGLATPLSIEEGDKVYGLGDDAHDVYLVKDGRIRFSLGAGNRPGGAGSIITEGMVFGWAALLDGNPRRVATAVALEDSTVYVIPGSGLRQLFDDDTASGYRVMRRLTGMITQDFMSVATN